MEHLHVSEPDAIQSACESVLQGELSWLLLRCADSSPTGSVALGGCGTGGLSEVKSQLSALDDSSTSVVLLRDQTTVTPAFVQINYLNQTLGRSQRARMMVLFQQIGLLWTLGEHATLTVDHLSNLTPLAIRNAISKPEEAHIIQLEQSTPSLTEYNHPEPERMQLSLPEIHDLRHTSKIATSSTKSSSIFPNIFKRIGNQNKLSVMLLGSKPDLPPPTPPKDGLVLVTNPHSFTADFTEQPPNHSDTFSDRGHASELSTEWDDESAVFTEQLEDSTSNPPFLGPIGGKWSHEITVIADPEERERRRLVAQRQRELEEQLLVEEEIERQAYIKQAKQQILREEEEEEYRRKLALQSALEVAALNRQKKEELECREEESRASRLKERQKAERLKRAEEHDRLEDWRRERKLATEEAVAREREQFQQDLLARDRRIREAQIKVQKNPKDDELISGWATLQTSESLAWRRRYFKLVGHTLLLYRTSKDTVTVLDHLELDGNLISTREWYEDSHYEHLKSIPHSFIVEFQDGREPWSFYCDTEEAKYQLLGLLHYASSTV